jgi:hypothetical protein
MNEIDKTKSENQKLLKELEKTKQELQQEKEKKNNA